MNGSSAAVTLAEVWNGTTWAVQASPNPAGAASSEFDGVSCTAGSACEAVGYYRDASGAALPLSDEWNGTTWTAQSMPVPSPSIVDSVSCAAATTCAATGYVGNGVLVEAWNGTTWSVQPAPSPKGVTSYLNGVACVSNSCTAVGETSAGRVLIEREGG